MKNVSRKDRAIGSIMGTLIGDALGLGCHWYYDLEAMRSDYGNWISDYTDQKPNRTDRFGFIAKHRHELGYKAGDLSQTAQLIVMLMESIVECRGYNEVDYTSRFDKFLETLDGTELSGGFTDRAERHLWANRKKGVPWGEAGSFTDTSEAAQRAVVFAALYQNNYEIMATHAYSNIKLTHCDRYIAGYSLSFALSAGVLINGVELENIRPAVVNFASNPEIEPMLSSWDINQQIFNGFPGADPSIKIDPRDACKLFGLNCTLGFMAPAAYFLIYRYPNDFENAVLHSINAGGNQMARSALTGALSGAMVGIQGIPDRFIKGLSNHEHLLTLAEQIAEMKDGS